MINLLGECLMKLRLVALVSSLTPGIVMAHEVLPTIADLTAESGVLRLQMDANIEALASGIDLDGLQDTNAAENVGDYDVLRALDASGVAALADNLLAGWNGTALVTAGGASVLLTLVSVDVPEVDNIELPRVSSLMLEGRLPAGADAVKVAWPDGAGALVLRQQGVEAPFTGYLEGGETSPEIDLGGGGAASGWETFGEYIPVGFDHILPKGLDHILFVLGLFFLSMRIRPLLWQVTSFTLAHTVTLALGALGWVTIPGSIVEPLIAASIVYVAVENILAHRLNPWRPAVVFGFGLLHGLGFASVLGEFGLPQGAFIPALLGFNIGVELGQLTVIALAALLLWLAVHGARLARFEGEEAAVVAYPVMFRAVSVTGSLLIALIGAWWVVERTVL